MKKKQKLKIDDLGTVIRRMPPLRHNHKWATVFYISWSEPVLFCLYTIQGNSNNREDWCRAKQLFDKSCKSRDLIFDKGTGLWRGANYRHKMPISNMFLTWVRRIDALTRKRKERITKQRLWK